ncbi:MAG: hypothetical protein Q8P41_13410 [Pseudomonadota bacterium]|nr:hypothetical protein [Pseudomonadota bacterium]
MILLALASHALAAIDPECQAIADGPAPEWYVDDQHQQDFLLNYFALVTTLSPLHGPVPAEPGHGSIGLELSIIPSLSCDRRLVLARSKTEDTNKAPVVPRPRVLFAFPKLGPVVFYAGAAYVPPLTVFGTRNVIASGEVGASVPLDSGPQFGLRYHYTLMKSVAEIATPFEEGADAVLDFYSGSTFGVDAMLGWELGAVTPYLSAGFTDASTFFYIGDDGVVSNNLTPYAGFAGSAGVQAHFGRLDLAGEFYTAPGYLYTGRLRAGFIF